MKEGKKITYRDIRKQELQIARARVSHEITNEKAKKGWPNKDSGLLEHGVPFQVSFEQVLPAGQNIREYIEEVLSDKKGQAIGLELGGVGSNLFASFSPGFFAESAGVALTDYRTNKAEDRKRNHIVIEGDMTDKETKRKVEEWRKGRKFDVIFQRLYGAHDCLPNEPFFMAEEANHWYKRLDGLWLAEVPDAFIDFMPSWNEKFADENSGLESQSYHAHDVPHVVRLRKLENAPVDLPILDKRKSLEIYKDAIQMDSLRKKRFTTLASDDGAQT